MVLPVGCLNEKGHLMRKRGFVVIVSLGFVFATLLVSPGARATTPITCNGKVGTIFGSGVIKGTTGSDVIIGSTGNDRIDGGGGNDTICGEGGDDVIDGGAGNDVIWGDNAPTDPQIGMPGNDTVKGSTGRDSLNDIIGTGQTFDGGAGDDRIDAVGTLRGGSGSDSLGVGGKQPGGSTLDGGSDDDTCQPRAAEDTLISCEVVP
jgi:Ca2+-binding RTX toxin-like protein